VSHHDHHRHSAYLLAHVDAAGFSQSQQRYLAALVLGQRGGLRKVEASLAGSDYPWQLLCLRLAAIVCHARSDAQSVHWRLQRQDNVARLGYDRKGTAPDPRTLYLLREEAGAWQRVSALTLVVPEA
jgi:exopolyphosphatase/guanosine-5'-triphosphate,3'-diphosphate pyrophosphatase